jgi:Peptidase family M28
MRRIVLLSYFGLFCSQIFGQNSKIEYQNSITAADLEKHLKIIAADDMEGRDTGSEGQRKAAKYIIANLESLGLTPASKDAEGKPSYLQEFNLYKSGWKEQYVMINDKKKVSFKDYYPSGLVNVPEERKIETVFVGYGIKNENKNDYSNKDIKGKAVVFLEGIPVGLSASNFEGKEGSVKKQKLAQSMGAAFVFEVSAADETGFKSLAAERKAILSRYNRMALKNMGSSSVTVDPNFVISQNMAADILGLKPKIFKKLITGKKVKTKNTFLTVKSERGSDLVPTANIAALIKGTDKSDEYVVVSAHYDHVGVDDKGRIYNGADDDGSGTCALLELAEAMSKAKTAGNGPRRNVLFLWVTGEEKGLLGSQYYTDIAPLFPLEKTICDLNIDMIGRIDKEHEKDENYVYIIGSDKLSSELYTIAEKANKDSENLFLDYTYNDPKDPNRFYYRSDHYNFAKNKIPVAFYFTGVHADYHQPGDDVEKIMFPKYTKIVKVVFNTLWELANREERIKVDSNKP